MLVIPTQPVPNQAFTVNLADQVTQINISLKQSWLYTSVYVSNDLIVDPVISQNLNPIVRSKYLGFVGDLVYVDLEGQLDPFYEGLGTRFRLCYLTPEEMRVRFGI